MDMRYDKRCDYSNTRYIVSLVVKVNNNIHTISTYIQYKHYILNTLISNMFSKYERNHLHETTN